MRGSTLFGWCAGLTLGLAALAMPQAAQAWCYVDLDKCVLIDHDGDGFDDETCVDPGQADAGDMVKWQYTVSNTSDWHWDLHYCVLDDPQAQFNYQIPGAIASPTTANGAPSSVTFTTDATQCVDLYNVAEVNCECYESGVDPTTRPYPANRVSDTDDATLTCVPQEVPGIRVTKECEPQSEGYNDVTITIYNTGDVDFLDCRVTDPLATDCEGLTGPIAAHTSADVTCSIPGLQNDVLNEVSVTCETGTEQLTDTASDLCEVREPDFRVRKVCDEQYLFNRTLTNDFTVYAENTGASDLTCRITADSLDRGGGYAEIPQCEGSHDTVCWECDRTMGSLPVGATRQADCRVYNLPESMMDRVEVTCTDGYQRLARTGEDLCEVPEEWDFEVTKVCEPQYLEENFDSIDGGLPVNEFGVFVSTSSDADLECAITGEAVGDGETFAPIEVCDFESDGLTPCYVCEPAEDAGSYLYAWQCALIGLPQSAYDRVRVTCTDGSTRKSHSAQDWCAVPGLTVDKECEPYENNGPVVLVDGVQTHVVDIDVTNTSDLPLTNCAVVDELDVECVNGECPWVECDIDPFDLAAGATESFSCQVYGAYDDVLNEVEVTCEYDGYTVTAEDEDWCETEDMAYCIDRSPGYWSSHHDVRNYVIETMSPEFCGGTDFFGALCDSGSLEFHCAAAALDLATTELFDGTCVDEENDDLAEAFADCCTGTDGVCGGELGCNERLDALYDDWNIEFCQDLPEDFDGSCSAGGDECPSNSEVRRVPSKPNLFTPFRTEPRLEAPEAMQRKLEMLRERLEIRDLRVE